MEDLSFLRYFLVIEVAYSSRDYLLSQQKYIADLLDCATLSDPAVAATSSSVFTHMKLHLKLRRDDGTPLSQPTQYRSLWVLSFIFLLFLRMFMYSANFSVHPPQLIMRRYFRCFVISEAPFLDYCYTVLIYHFLFGHILILDGLMILTHAAPS